MFYIQKYLVPIGKSLVSMPLIGLSLLSLLRLMNLLHRHWECFLHMMYKDIDSFNLSHVYILD